MASSKHLSQLLKEDQEPFILHNYINERRCQLKKPVQVQRRRSNSENSKTSCRINLCKNACFISSGDVQNSPLFDFSASPCKNSNTLFIQIPSSTAAMLLEAALRIQSNQSDDTQKTKTPKNFGFSLFGSILKKLTRRGQTKSKVNKEDRIQVSVKDILRWNSMDGQKLETQETTKESDEKRVSDVGASCSGISSLWSENIEEKSTELDTSTSRSEDSEETECVVVDQRKHGSSVNSQEKKICSSSFEFVPQNRSSLCRHSPEMEFLASSPVIQSSGSESPVASPKRYIKQAVKNEEHTSTVGQKLDEEKEHNSPVSVLDPHFEENDDEQQEDDQEEEEQNGIKLESRFDFVNRTRQQLLDKLRRFELLTELDPIELEKRIAEDHDHDDEEEYSDDEDSISEHNEKINVFAKEVVSESNFFKRGRAPLDMKNLFKHIITKEGEASKSSDEVFKEVDSNTIDMMIEFDFRKDGSEWTKFQDELQEMGKEIELSIFSFLVEELAVELIEDKIRTINMEFCSLAN